MTIPRFFMMLALILPLLGLVFAVGTYGTVLEKQGMYIELGLLALSAAMFLIARKFENKPS